MPTCNPKLKYSHAITHDATTLKRPRPTACCPRAAEIFNFRLIRRTQSPEISFLVKHSLLDLHGKTRHSGWKIKRVSGSCTSSSCSEENLSHQWCLTLTPNNSKMIKRMTCHYFQRLIRRYVSYFSNRAALVLTIPLGKLQKIWL